MVPGGRPLISIVYKYNVCNVLYFIVKEDAIITKAGMYYLSKYPEQFSNVSISLLLILLSCLSYLDLLMRLSPTENQGSLI